MLHPIIAKCPSCGLNVTLLLSNQSTVVNGPYMSAVIVQHPDHVVCQGCGTTLAPAIVGVQWSGVIATPVPPREEVKKILAIG